MAGEYVRAAQDLAARVLVPAAERVDREGVPRSHVGALQEAGLLGLTAPAELGGGGAGTAEARQVTEVLAGACGATWFVATQHATPLATVLDSANLAVRDRWAGPLARSEVLAGVAVSQLRRPTAPVRATRSPGGWRLDGRVDWLTSWGLAEVVLLGAVTAADEVLLALLPAREAPGLRASGELDLAVMRGAHNVGLTLDALEVSPEQVARHQPRADWLSADRLATANARPAVFGLLATILDRLRAVSDARGSAAGADLAASLAEHAAGLRTQAYRLLDDVPAGEELADRLRLRAESLELLNRAATALVVTGAGTSMLATNPAQRLAREALFHLVQAQTPVVREVTLAALARPAPAGSAASGTAD